MTYSREELEEAWTGEKLLQWLVELSWEEMQLPVRLEGCDCSGLCGGAEVMEDAIDLGRLR